MAVSGPVAMRHSREITQWEIETDVAIVGFGGAGACAAIEAADAGAQVQLFELASASGGSTALSSAELYLGGSGGTPVQRSCGYSDSSDNMKTFLKQVSGANGDPDKIDYYVDHSVAHFEWLQDLGVPFKHSELKERAIMALTDDCLLYTGNEKAWPFCESASPVPRGHNLQVEGDNGGPLLMKILTEQVNRRGGIEVHYDTRVIALVSDDAGAVVGLVARIDLEEVTVRARRGVILCAGGFCMNEEMVHRYAPFYAGDLTPLGNPGDMGSGILMGLAAGAGVVNMQECFVTLPFYPPASLTYGIFVNDKGQRFINEDCYHGRVAQAAIQQQRLSSRRIYLVADADAYADYESASYLQAPIAATGESIGELEAELGLPAGALVETVERYNTGAAAGADPLYHKDKTWLRELKAPFVALDCTIGRGAFYPFFTLGGLDTLPTGEVLTPERRPIPGLYAAGRTAAGIPRTAAGYASGMSVGDATFSGRMAGLEAARRTAGENGASFDMKVESAPVIPG